jgi:DNA-binding MarR family transcriptional regulator
MTDEVDWLDRDEQRAWVANAAVMIRLPAALDARMQRETGLTLFEYLVLSALSMAEEWTLGMSALASETSASLSRLSHVAKRLEERGLLTRERVPGSGRRTCATLTAAGWDEVVASAPSHVQAVRDYFIDVLRPEDLETVQRIGRAVGERLDEAGAGGRNSDATSSS